MNYIELNQVLRKNKLHFFTLRDIRNLFPKEKKKTLKNNFTRWILKGYYNRLRKNLYEVVDQAQATPDLYVANRLYEPSYVSLETALSFYSIIPDVAANVTSVTTRPTRTFKNRYGSFYYRTCKKKIFTGYMLMSYDGFKIYIADKEKALVDFLYYRLRSGFPLKFDEERLSKKILKSLNWKKASRYAKLFNNKTVKTLKKCKEFAKC